MDITSAHINFFKKEFFYSVENENIRHIKILPFLSIVQSTEGSYDFALKNDKLQQTGEGGFFIAPSEVQQTIVHHVNKNSGKMSARWIFIDVSINNIHKLDTMYQFPTIINDDKKDKLNEFFDRIFSTDNILENYGDCYKLLSFLIENSTSIKKESNLGIQNVVSYMRDHYMEQITIKELSRIVQMSESGLYSSFKKALGDSPISYLNHYRLSLAVNKLTESKQSINEIAESVGIHDPLYFSKLFKKTYGVSPKEYRQTYARK